MRLSLGYGFLLFSLFAVHSPVLAAETDAPAADAVPGAATGNHAADNSQDDADQQLFGSLAGGTENKTPVTKEDLEGLRTEVNVLREQWQRKLDKGTVLSTRNLTLNGNFQVRYGVSGGGVGSTPVNDGFNVSQVQLSLKGNLYRDYEQGKNLDYAIGLTTDKNTFNIVPNDVYLSYYVLPSLDPSAPLLKITAGQQKKPFGLEATTGDDKKPTINGAQFASAMKLNERDIGILLSGDLFPAFDYGFKYRVPLVEYYFMVLNGNGPVSSTNLTGNDNNRVDLLGRIVFNAPVEYSHPLRGLSLGGSVYWGDKSSTASGAPNHPSRNRFGVDLAYVNTPIGFTLEYVTAVDPGSTKVNNKTVFKDVRSDAYTFTLFYNFGEQFVKGYTQQDRYDDWWPISYQPFFRYDRLNPDRDFASTHTDIFTLGFNWFFAETTKLQANYNRTYAYVNKQRTAYDDQFIVQFQFGF